MNLSYPKRYPLPFWQQLAVLPILQKQGILGMKPEDLKAVLDAAKQRKQRSVAASPPEAMFDQGWLNNDRDGGLVKTPQRVE